MSLRVWQIIASSDSISDVCSLWSMRLEDCVSIYYVYVKGSSLPCGTDE